MNTESNHSSRQQFKVDPYTSQFVCVIIVSLQLLLLCPTAGLADPPLPPTPQQLEDWKNVKILLDELGAKTLQKHIFPRSPSFGGGLNFSVYQEDHFDESEAKLLGKVPKLKSLNLECSYAAEAISSFTPDNQIDSLVTSGTVSINNIVNTFPNLEYLYQSVPRKGTKLKLQPLATLSRLKELVLYSGGSFADVDAILKNLTGCKNLETINLRGEFSSEGLQALKSFPKLKTFWISGTCKDNNLDGIAPGLEATQLKSLRIALSINDKDQYLPIPDLGRLPHLEQVILFAFRGDDLSGLNGATNLKSLELHCDANRGSGCRVLANLSTLADNVSLEQITFSNNTPYSGLLREHLRELPRFPNLKAVPLGIISEEDLLNDDLLIRDEELQMLSGLSNLESLQLGGQKLITGEGVKLLVGLKKLKYLGLSGTSVDDDAMSVVAQIPSLERVGLVRTQVTEAGLKTLVEKLPNLQQIDAFWLVDINRQNEINIELRRLRGTR